MEAEPLKTTAENIADALREEILRGRLKSEQGLRQSKLANRFGVSTIPVREALVHLNTEGLVDFHPNRGAFVAPLSTAELREIYALRGVLEPYALTQAMSRLSDEHIERCEQVLKAMDAEQDNYRWSVLNWEFHATQYSAAEMPRLSRMIRDLHIHVIRYIMHNIPDPHEIEMRSNHRAEHHAILDACRGRDAEIGVILLQRHLNASLEVLTRFAAI